MPTSYELVGYLVKNGALVDVYSTMSEEELYVVVKNPPAFQLYQEHLDGPLLDEEQAKEIFPEEFI